MVRKLEPCGSYAAFRRHERAGETPCAACSAAARAHQARMYQNRKAKEEQDV